MSSGPRQVGLGARQALGALPIWVGPARGLLEPVSLGPHTASRLPVRSYGTAVPAVSYCCAPLAVAGHVACCCADKRITADPHRLSGNAFALQAYPNTLPLPTFPLVPPFPLIPPAPSRALSTGNDKGRRQRTPAAPLDASRGPSAPPSPAPKTLGTRSRPPTSTPCHRPAGAARWPSRAQCRC